MSFRRMNTDSQSFCDSNLITMETDEIKTWWVLHGKLIWFQEEQSRTQYREKHNFSCHASKLNASWQALAAEHHHCTNNHNGKTWDPQIRSQLSVCTYKSYWKAAGGFDAEYIASDAMLCTYSPVPLKQKSVSESNFDIKTAEGWM